MTNLTITVSEELLRRARARAAREGTSVNAVLRTRLADYADDDALAGAAWDHFLEIARTASGRSPQGRRTWRRAELQRPVAGLP